MQEILDTPGFYAVDTISLRGISSMRKMIKRISTPILIFAFFAGVTPSTVARSAPPGP
jgi:hypothetical protein